MVPARLTLPNMWIQHYSVNAQYNCFCDHNKQNRVNVTTAPSVVIGYSVILDNINGSLQDYETPTRQIPTISFNANFKSVTQSPFSRHYLLRVRIRLGFKRVTSPATSYAPAHSNPVSESVERSLLTISWLGLVRSYWNWDWDCHLAAWFSYDRWILLF